MKEPKPSKFTFGVWLTVCLIAIGLMLSILMPNLRQARVHAATDTCIANLMQIEGAKKSWLLENQKGSSDLVDVRGVANYLRGGILPTCPAGGSYQVHLVKDKPTCTLGHTLGHSI